MLEDTDFKVSMAICFTITLAAGMVLGMFLANKILEENKERIFYTVDPHQAWETTVKVSTLNGKCKYTAMLDHTKREVIAMVLNEGTVEDCGEKVIEMD